MDLLPVFLNLRGRLVLVAGAGSVALRKVELLLAAQARVRTNFTLNACVARYESLYRGLLCGKQPCEIEGVQVSVGNDD